jgi:hypothetical protein
MKRRVHSARKMPLDLLRIFYVTKLVYVFAEKITRSKGTVYEKDS